jgi:hypothetical protein
LDGLEPNSRLSARLCDGQQRLAVEVAVTDRWAELQLCKNRDIWRNVFDSMSDIWH